MSRELRTRSATAVLATVILALAPGASIAQTASLPGGASSLTETHGNWTVSCTTADAIQCAVSQEQVQQNGQRVLTANLSADGEALSGRFVLPFGLSLERGVSLRIGEDGQARSLPFTTCFPAGCLAPVSFDAAAIEAMGSADAMILTVYPVDGPDPFQFSLPLPGFAAAASRTFDLAAPE